MDFKIATLAKWNIRGMCNEIKQKEVMKFIEIESSSLCCD